MHSTVEHTWQGPCSRASRFCHAVRVVMHSAVDAGITYSFTQLRYVGPNSKYGVQSTVRQTKIVSVASKRALQELKHVFV